MPMLPNYKEIIDLLKKGATIEAQEKIMEYREAAIELQEQNLQLKERVRELDQQQKLGSALQWDETVYWKEGDSSNHLEGPYCQPCYDTSGKLVRLHKADYPGGRRWYCYACDKVFTLHQQQ